MKHLRSFLIRGGILTTLTACLASAYPMPGTLSVLGPSDFVGLFTLKNSAGTSSVSGYGGGFESTLNTTMSSETALMFCVDFSNDVSIPDKNVPVNVSTLTDGSNISETRFGDGPVTSWRSVTYVDPSLSTFADLSTLDGASALQRYQMAAYLVSNYSFFGGPLPTSNTVFSDPNNLGIQSAIWAILDSPGENYVPPTGTQDGNVDTWLKNAAEWMKSGDKSILSKFEIVSDASIVGSTNPLNTGIQEFLTTVPATVPEPSFYGVLAFGLGALLWRVRRERSGSDNSVPTNKA